MADFFQTEVLDKSHEKPVLVDFWAPWCGPCRVLGPTIERLAKESKGRWRLVKVNSDRHPDLARRGACPGPRSGGVRGIPAVKLFVGGAVTAEFTGALPEHALRQWLDQHLPASTS